MTVERVQAVLEARDPGDLIERWISNVPASVRRIGLPGRICAWIEGDEPCREPVRAVNAKFCEAHASASTRAAKRAWKQVRGRKSNPR
jgi:hypothetical protein